jgi:SAM-dependent methyltransferase
MKKHPEMSFERFTQEYESCPPWDLGRPQPFLRSFFRTHVPASPVVDVGCGTGALSIFLASLGCIVLGIDFIVRAIERARQAAAENGSDVRFEVYDVFSGHPLRTFRAAVDSLFFHTLDDDARALYASFLESVVAPGGRFYVMSYSVSLGVPGAPRVIKKSDIERTFGARWRLLHFEPCVAAVSFRPQGVRANFAIVERASV